MGGKTSYPEAQRDVPNDKFIGEKTSYPEAQRAVPNDKFISYAKSHM